MLDALIPAIAVLCAPALWAQTPPPAAPAGGNAGMQIANSGAPNGVAACASCHGAQGEGNAAANFPRIAGQSQTYLARQIKSYADGRRDNAVMAPIAKALDEQQINAVAAYYAGLQPPSTPAPAPVPKRGQQLATVGDDKIGVQGCVNCHGPGGTGEPPGYPYLAGQHHGYLVASLTAWKNGTRSTDPSQQMNIIAKRLSDSDIAALAAYYAAQPAPGSASGTQKGGAAGSKKGGTQ
ncbi:c-type cytochrome [Noviherbaspirillum cavernae]|uniref:c-type cytochrome n=1 Tax=Noviherbaspirillum cavernae TaxID=2320862 RepID=UPI001F5BC1D2|nr:c-type cytochrome [Noviherbaspirillum cavernae]